MPSHRAVTMEELTQYLHLPEKAVAKQLGICLTSLKKLCRQHGITRWPYRKLKSLDKKIAKAENGTGAGCEDAAALKAKAEELKKEKMSVAFTYGLKEKAEGEESDTSAVSSIVPNDKPKVKKPKPEKKEATPCKDSPGAADGRQKESPSPKSPKSIPTPPDGAEDADDDFYAEEEDQHTHMLDENGMHPTEWERDHDTHARPEQDHEMSEMPEAPDHAEHEVQEHHDLQVEEHHVTDIDIVSTPKLSTKCTQDVEMSGEDMQGEPLSSIIEEDKDGSVKVTIITKEMSSSMKAEAESPAAANSTGTDTDMQIANALASVHTTRDRKPSSHHPSRHAHVSNDGSSAAPPMPSKEPKFDVEGHASFHPELMDSEFFSALPSTSQHVDEDDFAASEQNDKDTSPHSASSATTVPDAPEMCDLPPDHSFAIGGEDWDHEDAGTWFSPDTERSKDKKTTSIHKGLTPVSSPAATKATQFEFPEVH